MAARAKTVDYGQRKGNVMAAVRLLRQQAAQFSEDIATMTSWVIDRADRMGWEDAIVVGGLNTIERLEHERAGMINKAKRMERGAMTA
jgi:hypothetical protein